MRTTPEHLAELRTLANQVLKSGYEPYGVSLTANELLGLLDDLQDLTALLPPEKPFVASRPS